MDKSEQIIKSYNKLKSKRSSLDAVYEDITRLIMPSLDGSNTNNQKSEGTNNRPISSVPTNASFLLGSSIFSYTYSQSARNFVLTPSDNENNDELQKWLQDATNKLTKQLQTSNFAQMYSTYTRVWGTVGCACATVEIKNKKLHFEHLPITGNLYFTRSGGDVNSVYRLLMLTANEAMELFGENQLSDKQKKCLTDPSKMNDKHDFIHAVYPNPDYKKGSLNIKQAKYVSIYVDKKEKKIVKESGYRSMRFFISNFVDAHDGSDYGIGSGHVTLPAVKEINRTEKQLVDAFDITARPVMVVKNDDELDVEEIAPNSVVYTDGDITYLPTNTKPEVIMSRIGQLTNEINQGFYVNVLMAALMDDRSNTTATEIEARKNEKISAILPMTSNLRESLWSKMISTCLELLIDVGEIQPPPPEISQGIEIEYISLLDAQMAVLDSQKTMIALQGANAILGMGLENPHLNKVAKTEKMAKQHLESHNVDIDLLVTDSEREEIQQAEDEQRVQELEAQRQQTASQNLSPIDLSKRPEKGSPLDQIEESGLM